MIINQLPSVPSAADADEIVVEIGTTTYKIKKSDFLKEFMPKSGGEFTGNVTVNGFLDVPPRRCEATLSAAGWYRAIVYNAYDAYSAQGASGEIVTIKIVYTSSVNVQHEISLWMSYGKVAFLNETSHGTTNLVDKIRYTYAGAVGYVDIHITSSSSATYNVSFEVASRTYAQERWVAGTLTSVADSPSGETVLEEYTFTGTSAGKNVFTPSHGTSTFGGCWYSRNGEYVTVHVGLTGITANTNHIIGTLPVGYRPVSQCCSAGSSATYEQLAHLYVRENGDIDVWSPNTMASLDATFMWR